MPWDGDSTPRRAPLTAEQKRAWSDAALGAQADQINRVNGAEVK